MAAPPKNEDDLAAKTASEEEAESHDIETKLADDLKRQEEFKDIEAEIIIESEKEEAATPDDPDAPDSGAASMER